MDMVEVNLCAKFGIARITKKGVIVSDSLKIFESRYEESNRLLGIDNPQTIRVKKYVDTLLGVGL